MNEVSDDVVLLRVRFAQCFAPVTGADGCESGWFDYWHDQGRGGRRTDKLKIVVIQGEILELKEILNEMTRVGRELETEGRLGG